MNLRDVDAFDINLVPQRPPVRDPATALFAMAAQELMHRPDQFKSQEIKDVLWSFSKVGIRHPALFKSVAMYLRKKPPTREVLRSFPHVNGSYRDAAEGEEAETGQSRLPRKTNAELILKQLAESVLT